MIRFLKGSEVYFYKNSYIDTIKKKLKCKKRELGNLNERYILYCINNNISSGDRAGHWIGYLPSCIEDVIIVFSYDYTWMRESSYRVDTTHH